LSVLPGRSLPGAACWSDDPEESICLLVRTCREVQRVRARIAAATECQSPQTVDSQWIAELILQLIDERAVIVEDIDSTIAEVANENLAAEAAERKRCARDTPWRVERPSACKATQQVAVGIEYVDESTTAACIVVVLLFVLLCVGDEKVAIDVRDTKRGIAGWDVRVGESAVGRREREQAVRTVRPKYIDLRMVIGDDGTVVKALIAAETVLSSTPSEDKALCASRCGQAVQVTFEGKKEFRDHHE
jgi:hypothetical protein